MVAQSKHHFREQNFRKTNKSVQVCAMGNIYIHLLRQIKKKGNIFCYANQRNHSYGVQLEANNFVYRFRVLFTGETMFDIFKLSSLFNFTKYIRFEYIHSCVNIT